MAAVWDQIGPPLRPSAEDIILYQRLSEPVIAGSRALRILLLGVTPELYRIPWPADRDFLAVDHTVAMIESVWPGRKVEVLAAKWQELPLPKASRDLALCDGGLHLLDFAAQQRLIARLSEVVRPGGLCVFRFFALPKMRENSPSVLRDLLDGKIPEMNSLKLRLAMALQKSPEEGVPVREVRRELLRAVGDWNVLAARLRWSPAHVRAIDAYQGSSSRYHFLSIESAIELFCSSGEFRLGEVAAPSGATAVPCPIVSFVRL